MFIIKVIFNRTGNQFRRSAYPYHRSNMEHAFSPKLSIVLVNVALLYVNVTVPAISLLCKIGESFMVLHVTVTNTMKQQN